MAQPTLRPTQARMVALNVAGLGALTLAAFYVWNYTLQAEGKSAAAIGMASMQMDRMGIYWAFPLLEASGLAALLWAYIGVVLGLLEAGRRISWLPLRPLQMDRLHRHIALLVIGLTAVHVAATANDAMGDSWAIALIPFQEGWKAAVWGYNLGIFSFYLMLLLGPTYYLRQRFGTRAWRFAHRFTVLIYALALWHTLLLGEDIAFYSFARPILWAAQIPLLFLFARRLLQPAAGRRRLGLRSWRGALGYGLAGAGAAAIVGIVALLVGGSAGFVPRV